MNEETAPVMGGGGASSTSGTQGLLEKAQLILRGGGPGPPSPAPSDSSASVNCGPRKVDLNWSLFDDIDLGLEDQNLTSRKRRIDLNWSLFDDHGLGLHDRNLTSTKRNYDTRWSRYELTSSSGYSTGSTSEETESFWLCKSTGKKCIMLCARKLSIAWQENPNHWRWISFPGSRFPEVAKLHDVCWLDIRGKIQAKILSMKTVYAAYLVYKIEDDFYGLGAISRASFKFLDDNANVDECSKVYLTPTPNSRVRGVMRSVPKKERYAVGRSPQKRMDGWMEICLGEVFNDDGEGELEMHLFETKLLNWKKGLVVEGIEVRPKEDGLASTYPPTGS